MRSTLLLLAACSTRSDVAVDYLMPLRIEGPEYMRCNMLHYYVPGVLLSVNAYDDLGNSVYEANEIVVGWPHLVIETEHEGMRDVERSEMLWNAETLRYETSVQTRYLYEGERLIREEGDGWSVRYEYDREGRILAKVTEAGSARDIERWDWISSNHGDSVTITGPQTHKTLSFDLQGRLVEESDEVSSSAWRWDGPRAVERVETDDATEVLWSYEYDEQGRLAYLLRDEGLEESYQWMCE